MTNLERALEGREEALNRVIPPLPYKIRKLKHDVIPARGHNPFCREDNQRRLKELVEINRSSTVSYVNEELRKICLL